MLLKVFSLFDKKVGIHSIPMFFQHEGYFMRAVSEIVADPKTHVGRHPADFDMHYLGQFDDNTGQFSSEPIRSLGSCVALVPARADTFPFPSPFDHNAEAAQ